MVSYHFVIIKMVQFQCSSMHVVVSFDKAQHKNWTMKWMWKTKSHCKEV